MGKSASFLSFDKGIGVFESLRAYGGVIFRLEEHLDRLFESAKSIGLEVPKTRQEIRRDLEKAVRDLGKKNVFIRLTLIANGGAIHELPLLSILVTERRHPPAIYQKGVQLKTSPVRRNLSPAALPEAKSTDFMNQILGTLDPSPSGNDEILFLNAQGYLTEARTGNLFIVCGGEARLAPTVITPPPHGLLNGVTRRFVIECALLGGISVDERPLMRHDLFNAQEAFLTNTSWEILPVCEVDGREIGTKVPGPLTQKLQALFRQGVERETKKHQN